MQILYNHKLCEKVAKNIIVKTSLKFITYPKKRSVDLAKTLNPILRSS